MERSHNNSKRPEKPGKTSLNLKINTVVVAALSCLLCVIILLLARSYSSLLKAILQERIDYVEEISAQIMTNQLFMANEYSEEVVNLANLLERENTASLDDIHELAVSKNKADILLMSEVNDIIDLNGKHISMPNNSLTQKMLGNSGVTELFTSLNFEEDSWLFAAPISPKEIDGTVYKAVILCISADEFRDNMTISLLDKRGASYIIDNSGRIKIKPLDDNLSFIGFNLFSSMLDQGVSDAEIEKLQAALLSGRVGSTVLRANSIDWLIGHTPIDGETSIVVAIPLTLTAAQTYEGLSGTIVLSALTIIVVALISVLLILEFFRRDKAREKEALAVAAKSDFYSKMSHDIRTPLNAVIGLVQLARDDTDKQTVKDYLTQSLSSANYLLTILNDVLEMSRIESGKLIISETPFDMDTLLSDVKTVAKPLLSEKELTFTDEANEPFETEYVGDQVRIKQILTNLLSNAAKFTKPGGNIGLRVTRTPHTDSNDIVTMTVSDNGIGMSEEFLGRIFKPFEQEHSSYGQQYAGSGLGLSIVHDFVKRMGGTIEVSSKLDEGSTFTVALPLLRGKQTVAQQPQKQEATTFAGKRILLAEDNSINRMVAVNILSTKFAIQADTACNGETAVKMFSESAPGTYDMILMDVKMPVMDGLEATRTIRALPRPDAQSIPIIAFSANTYKEDVELSLAAGMSSHLSKPLDIKALSDIFKSFFKYDT